MKFTTTKESRLVIDVTTAKQLFNELRRFFEDAPVEDGFYDPSDLVCLASGTIEGRTPVQLTIYVDPKDDGDDDYDDESVLTD